jgi:hypothetical protein
VTLARTQSRPAEPVIWRRRCRSMWSAPPRTWLTTPRPTVVLLAWNDREHDRIGKKREPAGIGSDPCAQATTRAPRQRPLPPWDRPALVGLEHLEQVGRHAHHPAPARSNITCVVVPSATSAPRRAAMRRRARGTPARTTSGRSRRSGSRPAASRRRRPAAVDEVRLGDDEGPLAGMLAGAERRARDGGVVAGAGGLEVGQVDGVVDVAQCVGVDEADLDRVLVEELARRRVAARAHTRRSCQRRDQSSGDWPQPPRTTPAVRACSPSASTSCC